jgi:hypothetical protein
MWHLLHMADATEPASDGRPRPLSDDDWRLSGTPAYQMLVPITRVILAAAVLLSLLIVLFLLGLPKPLFLVLALPCFVVVFGGGLAAFVAMVVVGVSDLVQRRFRLATQREKLDFLMMFAGDVVRPLRRRLR